jgi:soluble lytic murein transglycosylase
MRRSVVVLFLAVAGCPANGNHGRDPAPEPIAKTQSSRPVAPAAPEPGAVELTEEMARPYFASGPAAKAAARFALEDWKEARRGFAALLKGEKDAATRARLTLMVALCDASLGNHGAAARGFEKALAGLPALADWLHQQAARAHYMARDTGKALAHARQVAGDSIAGADAELLVGDILRGKGDWAAVAAHYQKYLSDRPKGIRLAEARFRLAEALERRGKPEDAFALYRKVAVANPLTRWATDAQGRIDGLVARGKGAAQLQAAELIERGNEYFENMRNRESEADFEAALAAPGLDSEMKCVAAFHRAQSVFKQRDRTRAAPLFDEATVACEKTKNQDLLVKSSYQAGRSYSNIGKHDLALVRYERAEKDAGAEHSFGDDARLRQAEEQQDLNRPDRVTELLSSLPKIYPKGDMRAEATWRLAWRDYKEGKYPQAIGWLKKQIELVPIDDNYWAEGQPQYWMGRSYERLKKPAEAAAAYEQAIKLYPLSYYALLALNRLREGHGERFKAILAEVSAAPAGWDPSKPSFRFKPRALYASPGFQRALEFLRLGLGDQAEAELRVLGMTPPPGKNRVDDPDQQDKIWATAFLYHGAGRYPFSHWVTRWHVLDFKRQWPVGANRARWDIAYPKGWWALLDKHATSHGYATELLISFVREESAFDPLRESFANAIGLTQMIAPTAKRFAKGTGIEVSRAALRDPEKNVTIGSRFLAFLVNKFEKRYALVVPSYNAGEGATMRWLRIRGDWPVDEFAEEIPYDETRNYSKRVLSTYFAYSYLKDGTIPVMPNDIPASFIPAGGPKPDPGKRIKGN